MFIFLNVLFSRCIFWYSILLVVDVFNSSTQLNAALRWKQQLIYEKQMVLKSATINRWNGDCDMLKSLLNLSEAFRALSIELIGIIPENPKIRL
ncbi:hypothetical protein, partial [Hydrotalea sp.]|uniref:hypothetical protein n=1 Tax=Hydrotalea sp. TaxID=2881279 RepID=UPI002585B6E8